VAAASLGRAMSGVSALLPLLLPRAANCDLPLRLCFVQLACLPLVEASSSSRWMLSCTCPVVGPSMATTSLLSKGDSSSHAGLSAHLRVFLP